MTLVKNPTPAVRPSGRAAGRVMGDARAVQDLHVEYSVRNVWEQPGKAVGAAWTDSRRMGMTASVSCVSFGENPAVSEAARKRRGVRWKTPRFSTAAPPAGEFHPRGGRRRKPLAGKEQGSQETSSTPWTGAPIKTMIFTTETTLDNANPGFLVQRSENRSLPRHQSIDGYDAHFDVSTLRLKSPLG